MRIWNYRRQSLKVRILWPNHRFSGEVGVLSSHKWPEILSALYLRWWQKMWRRYTWESCRKLYRTLIEEVTGVRGPTSPDPIHARNSCWLVQWMSAWLKVQLRPGERFSYRLSLSRKFNDIVAHHDKTTTTTQYHLRSQSLKVSLCSCTKSSVCNFARMAFCKHL